MTAKKAAKMPEITHITFEQCVFAALNSGFLARWERLRGLKLAVGDRAAASTFLSDVFDLIYLRLPNNG